MEQSSAHLSNRENGDMSCHWPGPSFLSRAAASRVQGGRENLNLIDGIVAGHPALRSLCNFTDSNVLGHCQSPLDSVIEIEIGFLSEHAPTFGA